MATEHSIRDGIHPGDDGDAGAFWRHAFEGLVTKLPEPVFVIDKEGNITYWNEGAEDLTGYDASRAIGMPAYELFGTDGESETLAEAVVRTGEVIRETDIRSAASSNGETFHGRALGVPITTPSGDCVGAVEVITRVTEIIEQRETVQNLQERMTGDVESAAAALQDSASDVADDSQAIQELARAGAEGDGFAVVANEIKDLAEQSKERVDQIETIVDDIRDTALNTVESVEATNDGIVAATEEIETVVENQQSIVTAIQETDIGITEIADATDEQAASAEEIDKHRRQQRPSKRRGVEFGRKHRRRQRTPDENGRGTRSQHPIRQRGNARSHSTETSPKSIFTPSPRRSEVVSRPEAVAIGRNESGKQRKSSRKSTFKSRSRSRRASRQVRHRGGRASRWPAASRRPTALCDLCCSSGRRGPRCSWSCWSHTWR